MRNLWLIIIICLLSIPCFAQHGIGFIDYGANYSSEVFNDTDSFDGPGILGASDTTAQIAFQTIDASGGTLITACQTSDNFCFKFAGGELVLYVGGTEQVDYGN